MNIGSRRNRSNFTFIPSTPIQQDTLAWSTHIPSTSTDIDVTTIASTSAVTTEVLDTLVNQTSTSVV